MDKGRIDSKEECDFCVSLFEEKSKKWDAFTLEEEEEEEKGSGGGATRNNGFARKRAIEAGFVFFDRLEESVLDVRALCVLFLLRNARIFLVGIKSQRGRGVF